MREQTLDGIISHFNPHVNRSLAITRKEYKERWNTVQQAMKKKGYDLAYASGSELDRSDVAWLAGVYDPIIERYGILIPSEGKPVVVAGSEGGHVIADCIKASGADLALLQEFQISDEDYRYAEFEKLEDVVFRLVPTQPGKQVKIAIFSSSQFIPYDHVELFEGRFGSENVLFDVDLLQRIKGAELIKITRRKEKRKPPDSFIPITEDEFELLAEMLTEVAEDEFEDEDDLEDEEDFED